MAKTKDVATLAEELLAEAASCVLTLDKEGKPVLDCADDVTAARVVKALTDFEVTVRARPVVVK